MRIRYMQKQKMKLKTTTKMVLIASFSVLIISTAIFIVLNISNVQNSMANAPRLINLPEPKTSFEIESQIILPVEQQPVSRNNSGIVNKRKAVVIPQQ
jgi:hypothetical protein